MGTEKRFFRLAGCSDRFGHVYRLLNEERGATSVAPPVDRLRYGSVSRPETQVRRRDAIGALDLHGTKPTIADRPADGPLINARPQCPRCPLPALRPPCVVRFTPRTTPRRPLTSHRHTRTPSKRLRATRLRRNLKGVRSDERTRGTGVHPNGSSRSENGTRRASTQYCRQHRGAREVDHRSLARQRPQAEARGR